MNGRPALSAQSLGAGILSALELYLHPYRSFWATWKRSILNCRTPSSSPWKGNWSLILWFSSLTQCHQIVKLLVTCSLRRQDSLWMGGGGGSPLFPVGQLSSWLSHPQTCQHSWCRVISRCLYHQLKLQPFLALLQRLPLQPSSVCAGLQNFMKPLWKQWTNLGLVKVSSDSCTLWTFQED